jgi:hypothetical protein
MVSVVQREWAAKNQRATFKTPITVEDVLNSRMIAYPFRLLQCYLVTDGGGALIRVDRGLLHRRDHNTRRHRGAPPDGERGCSQKFFPASVKQFTLVACRGIVLLRNVD